MERPVTLKALSIRDENSVIHRKIDGKTKQGAKKGGVAHESRKALNDITNKSAIHIEASSQKKNSENKKCRIVEDGSLHHHVSGAEALPKKKISAKEKLNIAEEGFLHDHKKCIDAQKAAFELNFWDVVLPKHALLIMEKAKVDTDIDHQLELEEISSVSGCSDWSETSLPSTPIHSDSPFSWEWEPLELKLKEEDDDQARQLQFV